MEIAFSFLDLFKLRTSTSWGKLRIAFTFSLAFVDGLSKELHVFAIPVNTKHNIHWKADFLYCR